MTKEIMHIHFLWNNSAINKYWGNMEMSYCDSVDLYVQIKLNNPALRTMLRPLQREMSKLINKE